MCPSETVYDPPPRDRCEWPHLVQGCNGRYGNCYDKQPIIVLPTLSPNVKDRTCSNLPQCLSCKPATVPAYEPRAKGVGPRGYFEVIRNLKQKLKFDRLVYQRSETLHLNTAVCRKRIRIEIF